MNKIISDILLTILFGIWLGILTASFGITTRDWRFWLIIIPANFFFAFKFLK